MGELHEQVEHAFHSLTGTLAVLRFCCVALVCVFAALAGPLPPKAPMTELSGWFAHPASSLLGTPCVQMARLGVDNMAILGDVVNCSLSGVHTWHHALYRL